MHPNLHHADASTFTDEDRDGGGRDVLDIVAGRVASPAKCDQGAPTVACTAIEAR